MQHVPSSSVLNDRHVPGSFIPPRFNSLSGATCQKDLAWPGFSDFEVSLCWLLALLASNFILEAWVESGLG